MQMKTSKVKKELTTILVVLIKPFIIPILMIVILLALVCSITDIFYIAFNNDDKIDMKKEMKYYDTEKEYEKEEKHKEKSNSSSGRLHSCFNICLLHSDFRTG